MIVQQIKELNEWISHQDSWNRFAPNNPHMQFEWMVNWWRNFGLDNELFVLCVRDDDNEVCGYAPWFIDRSRQQGPTIRFLGSGKACGDHLSLISASGARNAVVVETAKFLVEASERWHHLELVGGDANDEALLQLCDELTSHNLLVHRRNGLACYVVPIEADWSAYLMTRSKPTRRKLRRSVEKCSSENYRVSVCLDRQTIAENWKCFVELHEKRRHSLSSDGCFDNSAFGDFLLAAALDLADAGMTELSILHFHDQPIAAELCFTTGKTTFYYQSGMDPAYSDMAPGVALLAFTASRSAERGDLRLDLLRGEEPYKIRWKGQRIETIEIRAASTAWQAQLRQKAWQVGTAVKGWLESKSILPLPVRG